MEETGYLKALNETLVWGTFDCQEINCFEILFYIVASLTFLVLVIFILLIFIMTKNCKKTKEFTSDEEKLTQATKKNGQVIESKQNEAYINSASESISEEDNSENSEAEQSEEEQRRIKRVYSKKEWEMHKKRTKLFEEQEAQKKINNSRNKTPHNDFGFSYADPDEIIDEYKTRSSSIPRLKIYQPDLNPKAYQTRNENGEYIISDDLRTNRNSSKQIAGGSRQTTNDKRRPRSTTRKSKRSSSQNRQKIVKSHNF